MHTSAVFIQGRFFKWIFTLICKQNLHGKVLSHINPPFSFPFQLSDTAVGQTGQEEPLSGKKNGRVIPVPQEEEER